MNKQERNKAIKEIKRLWNKVEYVLNNRSMQNYGTQLLRMNRKESQDYDTWRTGQDRGLTITEESKFFAVKRIMEYTYCLENPPSLDYFHSTLTSVYQAYSLANEFQTKIREVITEEEAKYLNALDYCELIEVSE